MKRFLRLIGLAALGGLAVALFRAVKQYQEDSVFDTAGPTAGDSAAAREPRSISPQLLSILADPADKGPVELMRDDSGKEWLVNRRNGYRYPVEDGIPIMLIEEGEKHRDERLISS